MKTLKEPDPVIDLRELLLGGPNRLKHVHRWSMAHVSHRESVAEHSFYVAFYTLIICRWCECGGFPVYLEDALSKALVHDLDEAMTGDFSRQFKYRTSQLASALNEAAADEVSLLLRRISPVSNSYNYNPLDSLAMKWKHAKEGSHESRIVAFSDFLAVVGYLWEEVSMSNVTLFPFLEGLQKYMDVFKEKEYSFLSPLIRQAQEAVTAIISVSQKRREELDGAYRSEPAS